MKCLIGENILAEFQHSTTLSLIFSSSWVALCGLLRK